MLLKLNISPFKDLFYIYKDFQKIINNINCCRIALFGNRLGPKLKQLLELAVLLFATANIKPFGITI